jgi:hypothetical protein
MKKTVLLIVLLCIQYVSCLAQTPDMKELTKDQWAGDIDYFAKNLVKKHGNAFHFTSEERFNRTIDSLKQDLPDLKGYEVVVRLQQIAAGVGDAHTYVKLPGNFKRYPVSMYWFGNNLQVIRTTAPYRAALGARLISIDGHPLNEIIEKISTILSNDENESFRRFNGPNYMVVSEILESLGITKSDDQAVFRFMGTDNKEFTITVKPIVIDPSVTWITPVEREPLFRQRMNEGFWFTYLEDLDAVYVNFKSYDKLAKNVNDLFELINSKHASSLIIDFRQNGGGDYTKVRNHFIPKVKENAGINQPNHLFVISGRRSFSAAMTNIIDFRKESFATILGEAPGEKPNSWQENDEMKLPNSGLEVSYSTRYYKFLENDSSSFEPDIKVEPNWSDYVNGVDPVMEKIKLLIKK